MNTNNTIMKEEGEVNMAQQLAAKYLPYWPLFIILVIFSFAGAYVYLRYVTPIYEATATLIIKDESRGGNDDSRLLESLNLIASKKNIENEIEVIQSRSLMEKVVKSLYLYAPVSQEGKVKSGDAYTLSPIMIEAQMPDSIQEVEKVIFSYDANTKTVTLNNKEKYPLNQFVSTPYGVLKFMPNRYQYAMANTNKNQLFFSLDNVQNTASGLLMSLKVTPNKQSAIVELTFKDAIPQRAVDIINQLITTYDRVSILEKNTFARNTLAFVDEQLNAVTQELDSVEKKIQQYRSGSNVVDIGVQGSYYLKNVSENDQKLGDINMQLSMLDLVEKNVANKQSGEMLAPSTLGVTDPTLTNLLTQLQASQADYDKLKKTVGPNNPALVSLGEQIKKLQPSILENIQNQKKGLGASRQSLYSTNSNYNSLLSSVPMKEKQLVEISRQHQNKANMYQNLLQRKQEAEMSLASVISNSRVVDKALAGKFPVSPKKKLIYIMAFMAAIGLGAGIIIIKDAITGKIKYRSEIEKMSSIPIIGEITFDKSKTPLVIEKGTRSFIAEEYRKLRISLSFLGIDSTHKKLLITSSISGEGKSFVAANLAVSIALTGKKTVLVDLDLNRPTQSEILNVNYEHGVSEFLSGKKEPREIIHKLDGHESLYFIAPGSLPENPTELLANGKVESLIEYLGNNFEMVVIDTSPAALVTDAYILSGLCDATLYVIRHGYTPKLLVKRLDENNQINPINNPAIIFNGLKTRGIFKTNYGYGKSYMYGDKYYGYGGAKSKKEKKSA
ncbi:MAG TPA: polysaccharide biosynthesis tyrosine autokinase [Ferruginibacter sp.]|nr:polysaccharide biosynthesis tyrosine autokinase [Chitinophagaceae bacterium]HQW91962.1 polysaccharide biosynthesis tyrosine autokinase [Ferruginibacter sp.]